MLYLLCSPLSFLCTVVLSFDPVACFGRRRAQVTSMTTQVSFLISVFAYLVIYQTRKGFIMIQGRVEIVEEFSEVLRCGCKGVLV